MHRGSKYVHCKHNINPSIILASMSQLLNRVAARIKRNSKTVLYRNYLRGVIVVMSLWGGCDRL